MNMSSMIMAGVGNADHHREFNRQSMALSELGGQGGSNSDDEQNEQLFLNINETKKDRLDFFTKDSDYYTNLLLSIVKTQSEAEIPNEILSTLEPVREKCQLIIF